VTAHTADRDTTSIQTESQASSSIPRKKDILDYSAVIGSKNELRKPATSIGELEAMTGALEHMLHAVQTLQAGNAEEQLLKQQWERMCAEVAAMHSRLSGSCSAEQVEEVARQVQLRQRISSRMCS